MKLKLVGHEYKYAVEQIMLSLFPDEKPHYFSDPIVDSAEPIAESRLSIGDAFAQSITIIHCGDKVFRGVARVSTEKLNGKIVTDRLLQRIIKQSFYRAAADFIDAPPVWGSLTGIRPAHIAAPALEAGGTKSAIKTLTRDYYVSADRAQMCARAAKSSLEMKRSLSQSDIAVYVGIPFCPTRCSYCSFVSNSVEKSFQMIDPFVELLLNEVEMAGNLVRELGLRVISIYIGGGTPTTLPPEKLKALLLQIKTSFDLSALREYTIEAGRPDTITEKKLEIMRKLGVDRICVNPQSMSDDVLRAIGRIHTADDARQAVSLVRQSGAVLNMDVIAGLPCDTPKGFKITLDTVLGFEPENITIHTLSLKKGSRIMLEDTPIPSGADVGAMLEYASLRLGESCFSPYYLYRQKFTSGGFENTGWCLPGYEGVYNICMMEELCTVMALGGGGVTKIISHDNRINRIFNAKYPREYIMHAEKLEEKFERVRGLYRNT